MRTLAALTLLAALALSGCSDDDAQQAADEARDAISSAVDEADIQLPDVDWAKYEQGLQDRIDELASSANCDELQKELDDNGQLDAEVVDYIKAKLEEAGC